MFLLYLFYRSRSILGDGTPRWPLPYYYEKSQWAILKPLPVYSPDGCNISVGLHRSWCLSGFVLCCIRTAASLYEPILFCSMSTCKLSRRTGGPHQSKDPDLEQAKRERTALYGKKPRKVKNPTVRAGPKITPVQPIPWAARSDLPGNKPMPPAERTSGKLNWFTCQTDHSQCIQNRPNPTSRIQL